MREYEIGSEAWMRERIERGLDPGEADRPEDGRLLHLGAGLAAPTGAVMVVGEVTPPSSRARVSSVTDNRYTYWRHCTRYGVTTAA